MLSIPTVTDFSIDNGWLVPAVHVASPNFNERPAGEKISLLVIHNISLPPGEFGSGCVQDFFCNRLQIDRHPYFDGIKHLTVSAHLLIERTGAAIQFVSFDDRAWHAGQSQFCGRENCNDFSIGIELEGTDDCVYSDEQYRQLVSISRLLMQTYPALNAERIVGHSDIAPGRKTDPGSAFDWQRFRSGL